MFYCRILYHIVEYPIVYNIELYGGGEGEDGERECEAIGMVR